jgi:hypothetical protein
MIKLFKPKPAIELPVRPPEPLTYSATTSAAPSDTTPSSTANDHRSAVFDLALAQVSVVAEMISYTVMGLVPTPFVFLTFTLLGSFGSGFSPAVQSVALQLYSRKGGKESGRLFGALSVVHALWYESTFSVRSMLTYVFYLVVRKSSVLQYLVLPT